MLNFLKNSFFLLNFFTFLFVPSLSDHPTELFASCLSRHNIKNFTVYHPGLENKSTYFKLLTFSIYNLRFARPTVPIPAAIILPESKEQLANTVVCVREVAWGIRVRCGGHSYEGTSSVATDGAPFVVVDMMNLDQVSVDLDSQTAWVEGGATLGQTYYAIAKSSELYGFSAGSCPTVGIGGHIAGGGFGLLSRKYGLAADNVEDALLVDANGRLVDRQGMGEDVFWAIRGGGGGIWGIVYAWKIKLLQVPQIITGFIVSRPGSKHQVAKLVNKWQHVAPKLTGGFYLAVFVGAGLPERKTIGISTTFHGFFLGPMSESLAIINEEFPELSLVEQECKEMSWIESILYFSGLDIGSSVANLKDRFMHDKHYFKAKSDYVRNVTPISGILSALDILEKEPKGYVILDPYGGVMQNISSEAIAFPHRKDNLYTIQYLVEWKESDDARSNEYIQWIREFYNSMAPYVSRGPRAAYVNYIDLDLGIMELLNTTAPTADAVEMARAWGEKYFLNNYDRLVKAKTSIDPYNIFRHQQGIPPDSMGSHSLKAGF